jgi:hypothetical protein
MAEQALMLAPSPDHDPPDAIFGRECRACEIERAVHDWGAIAGRHNVRQRKRGVNSTKGERG